MAAIPIRRRKKRTVQEALVNHAWVSDIQGGLPVGVLIDYLRLWDILSNFQLQPEMEDKHIWRFSANGQYSAKTAYEGFFLGATIFRPWEIIWKTWAPAKCPFFMWLVAHNKCWTADRLAKRGLPHPDRCPICDQESETINHLLIGCSFAREFWHRFLSQVGLQALSPQLSDSSFYDWWERITIDCSVLVLQGINSLIILGAWTIWTQQNNRVFDRAAPDVARALILSSEERKLWSMAGAQGISFLTASTSVE